MAYSIRLYQASDQARIEELFRSGMEYSENPESYIISSLNDDICRIPHIYDLVDRDRVKTGETLQMGAFFVAERCSDKYVVGMVGLERHDNNCAELRRMSVDSRVHRNGLGRMLFNHLLRYALDQGFLKVFLTTRNDMFHAVSFYQKCGMQIVRRYNHEHYAQIVIVEMEIKLKSNN